MKKSIHIYGGLAKFFRQTANTKITITTETKDKNDKKDPEEEAEEKAKTTKSSDEQAEPLFFVFHEKKAKDEFHTKHKEYFNKMEHRLIPCYGGMFSIYLAEVFDIGAVGICVMTQQIEEDCIVFDPLTGDPKGATSISKAESTENKKDKKEKKDKDELEPVIGQIFLKRNIPILIGGFIQVQNDDLDSYIIGGKLNIMLGIVKPTIITKNSRTLIDNELINERLISLPKSIVISVSLQVIFKIFDLEGSLIIGVNWAPQGITMKSSQISKEQQLDDDEITSTKEINFVTNHMQGFIAISIGTSFE